MKLSTKCRYGTRAMIEIARQHGRSPVKRRDISKSQKVSDSYLENILVSLRDAGLIESIRGAHGGYALIRPPAEITMLDIVSALEGDFAPVACVTDAGFCTSEEGCRARLVWRRLHQAQVEALQKITLQKLVEDKAVVKGDHYAI